MFDITKMTNLNRFLIIFALVGICLTLIGSDECGDGGEDCVEVEVGQCVIFVDPDEDDEE